MAPTSQAAPADVEGVGAARTDLRVPADWEQYETIVALARAGDVEATRAATQHLEQTTPDSIWLGRSRLATALAMERAGNDAEAATWFESAASALEGDDAHWARARLGEAETAARLGRHEAAFEHARSLRTTFPRTLAGRRARRLARRLLRVGATLLPSPAATLAEAELRLLENDAAGARALVEPLATNGGAHRDAALWVEARSWQASGDIDRATRLCRLLATTAERGTLAPTALYAAGKWRWNVDDDEAAAELFAEVRRRFPQSPEAVSASYALGRIHQTAGRFDEAVTAYDRVRAGRFAVDAGWGAAWSRYLAGRWHDAAARFRELGTALDAEGNAATYWEARSLANVGDPNAMATLRRLADESPDDYYGYMAARYLRGDPLGHPVATVLAQPPPSFPRTLSGPRADRARAYLGLGHPEAARRELDALAPTMPTEAMIEAYEAIGATGRALRLVRRSPLADDHRSRRLYPLGHWGVVAPEADQHGVDPLLVLALIRQESAFDDDAVSPADAHGLMQLVPSTAADVATALGLPPPDRWALHRVPLNVSLGTTLLAKLLREHDGSAVRALAAYNAGDPAVAKWKSRSGDRPDDEFVELISYAETRRYVKKVLGNYLRYRQLYAPSASATSFGRPPNAPFDMTTMTSPG